MAEVDYWTPTRNAFAALQLPAPEFTEKNLKRPPFRFIFEIVSNVAQRFAVYDDIFSADFKDINNIDSKEKKIEYLKTLVKYIEGLLKIKIDISEKKIVSGHESDKTNVFLQYVAMAVGAAQQDKARKKSLEEQRKLVAAQEQQQQRQENVFEVPDLARSGAVTFANPADYGMPNLPKRDSLPRKRSSVASTAFSTGRSSSTVSVMTTVKPDLMREAKEFNDQLAGYSLNLKLDEAGDVRQDGQSIVRMWEELQKARTDTTPSQIPVEALETAIKRQIDSIKQIHSLIAKNDKVIDDLEDVLT